MLHGVAVGAGGKVFYLLAPGDIRPRGRERTLAHARGGFMLRGRERTLAHARCGFTSRFPKGWCPVNPAVSLVRSYLKLNGYFTATEVPVMKKGKEGLYYEATDIDMLALRFPRASHIVAQGRPGPEDDLYFPADSELGIPSDAMDLIIAEVKEGKPRLNPQLMQDDTLFRALIRFGFCPPEKLAKVVRELQAKGEAWVRDEDVAVPSRVRIVAFGDGEKSHGNGYTVMPLKHVVSFVRNHLKRYHDVIRPIRVMDPTLGLLHLLEKLGED
jgi:hypothetical protein